MKLSETSPEAGSMTWRRGCEIRGSKHDGCEEYKWDGGNITVVECICADALCNKDVPDIPTTTPGNFLLVENIICRNFNLIRQQCHPSLLSKNNINKQELGLNATLVVTKMMNVMSIITVKK